MRTEGGPEVSFMGYGWREKGRRGEGRLTFVVAQSMDTSPRVPVRTDVLRLIALPCRRLVVGLRTVSR